ncbi:MAG: hypothetical protein HND47_17570 [Chloroflexi bacterium]|nr:hypothetical protein [Chloroflexota bacterium]
MHVELPSHRFANGKEQEDSQQGGDAERPAHARHVAFEIGRAAHFTVKRRAPVGPQIEEDHVGNDKEDRRQRPARKRRDRARIRAQLHRRFIDARRRAKHGSRVRFQTLLEGFRRTHQQHHHDDEQSQHPAVEGDLLNAGVGLHAQHDEEADDGKREDRSGECAVLGPCEPQRRVLQAQHAQDGNQDDVAEHIAVERHPQPQDEPPPGHRQDEPDSAAEDAALPDVIAARTRHHSDQRGVHHNLEENEDCADDQRIHHPALEVVHLAEAVQAEGDQVDGEQRVDERVHDRPRTHQAGRFTDKQVAHNILLFCVF